MNEGSFPSPEQVVAVARPRSPGQYRGTGRYPVTVGGYVVGYVEKRIGLIGGTLTTFWVAIDEDEHLIDDTFDTRSQAVNRLARTDGARWSYRAAALEGVFGSAVQREAEAAQS